MAKNGNELPSSLLDGILAESSFSCPARAGRVNNLTRASVKNDCGDIHIFMKKITKEIVDEIRAIRKDNADFFARMLVDNEKRFKNSRKYSLTVENPTS